MRFSSERVTQSAIAETSDLPGPYERLPPAKNAQRSRNLDWGSSCSAVRSTDGRTKSIHVTSSDHCMRPKFEAIANALGFGGIGVFVS